MRSKEDWNIYNIKKIFSVINWKKMIKQVFSSLVFDEKKKKTTKALVQSNKHIFSFTPFVQLFSL